MIIFSKILALILSFLAAGSDLKTCRIPNDLLICALTAAVFCRLLMADVAGFSDCLLGILVPFFLLWMFFRFRKMGAGDIKLFCVLGAFMGPWCVLRCMLCTFVCGGVSAAVNTYLIGKGDRKRFSKLQVAVFTVPAVAMWAGGLYG